MFCSHTHSLIVLLLCFSAENFYMFSTFLHTHARTHTHTHAAESGSLAFFKRVYLMLELYIKSIKSILKLPKEYIRLYKDKCTILFIETVT